MKLYKGPLDRKKMSKEVLRAYECLASLRARTKKQNLEKSDIDTREFIPWYLKEQKTHKFNVPSVSRIDHSKGYTWGNFILDEMANNSREGAIRNNLARFAMLASKKVVILDPKDDSILMIAPSIRDAARATNVSQRLVQFYVRGKYKKPRNNIGYKYIYWSET